MSINYCIPCSTPYANSELKRIYAIAKKANAHRKITCSIGTLNDEAINMTYGYLGVFSHFYFNKAGRQHTKVFNKSFIIDHSYTPKELKGEVFRLSSMREDLETQIFNKSIISGEEKDLIYEHIKKKSDDTLINLLVPKEIAARIKDSKMSYQNINVLIKNSSFQERVKQSAQPLINSWKKNNLTIPNFGILCVAFKPWEMKVDMTGKHRVIRHVGERIDLDLDRVEAVYCPTSMMALDFILKQCPTRISNGHPLYRILGNYIPRLSKIEAIDLVMNCIMKISFSTTKLEELNNYIEEMVI